MAEYIEREAVNALIKAECSPKVAAYLIDAVATIPAADVRPVVRGRWIAVANARGGHECSVCHEYAPSFQNGVEHTTNFCPNCGADMREES